MAPRLIAGGMATEAAVAHVLVCKYADHLSLYRQAQISGRQGIDPDRSTLAAWVGKAAYELKPVFAALIADMKRSSMLFMDETRAPVLDPKAGKIEPWCATCSSTMARNRLLLGACPR